MMTGFGMGFGIVGLLVMLLFWGGLIALAVWLIRAVIAGNNQNQFPGNRPDPDAKEIIKQRYARGEISREEFEQLKADIG